MEQQTCRSPFAWFAAVVLAAGLVVASLGLSVAAWVIDRLGLRRVPVTMANPARSELRVTEAQSWTIGKAL